MDDTQIREINKRYLHRDRSTDIIAFSQIERGVSFPHIRLLGDVVISVESARRQAQEAHATFKSEIAHLLIHGILHLLGYDHEGSAKKAKEMRDKERKLHFSITSTTLVGDI